MRHWILFWVGRGSANIIPARSHWMWATCADLHVLTEFSFLVAFNLVNTTGVGSYTMKVVVIGEMSMEPHRVNAAYTRTEFKMYVDCVMCVEIRI